MEVKFIQIIKVHSVFEFESLSTFFVTITIMPGATPKNGVCNLFLKVK